MRIGWECPLGIMELTVGCFPNFRNPVLLLQVTKESARKAAAFAKRMTDGTKAAQFA